MADYSNREIDHFMKDIKDSLVRIEEQTIRHNGRLRRLERWMWVLTGVVSTIMFLYGKDLSGITKTVLAAHA